MSYFRPACLREFSIRPAGAASGPSIVGFREHIFSGIGLLGEISADPLHDKWRDPLNTVGDDIGNFHMAGDVIRSFVVCR